MTSDPAARTLTLTTAQWDAFIRGLYERDDRLDVREAGQTYAPAETVDAYVLSGHAEALQSAEVDGDLWGTLQDLDETAQTDEEAWQKICDFYLGRECVLVRISDAQETDAQETEEWIFDERLLRRLGLWG